MLYNANSEEQNILDFWKKNKIFERSISERSADKPYAFYDGPPFATGTPHYGHLAGSTMKDIVPRFWTMKGFRVERVWGWDCHGLPIENIVEKELGITTKKELLEKVGVAEFNKRCREKVLSYAEEWRKVIDRLGRWVDMDHAYKTMDRSYMESVWWVFKQLYDKELVYEGFRSMHICPRCETTLSQSEVAEGYKEVKDISVVVKFKVTNAQEKLGIDGKVFALAWTTTPWTLPGNVALAVKPETDYVLVNFFRTSQKELFYEPNSTIQRSECATETVILAKNLLPNFIQRGFGSVSGIEAGSVLEYAHEVLKEIKSDDLEGLTYEPLFPYYDDTPNAFRIVSSDHVTTDAGTGIVHIAPAFGEDDFKVGEREKIPLVQHVSMNGKMKDEVVDFAGFDAKPKDDPNKTDIEIIKWLDHNGKLFSKKKIEHTYPHCWRCDTPLLNYATSSWFVNVTKLKPELLKNAENISWSPENMKEGRFGKWLEGARDWSISRQRFWASVMPVWRCDKDDNHEEVFGSVQDLEIKCGQKIDDLHKDIVDGIGYSCAQCSGSMRRIPDVLDTWFDSGSMPYAQVHYPFENKEKFETSFPAEYIGEGQDQTRAWFYYLHVLATGIMNKRAFNHVIVNGIVLAEDGKKMSKKLKNYPDPSVLMEKYGADALRFYLASSPVVHAENLNFSEEGVKEIYSKLINTLWNVYEFYELAAQGEHSEAAHVSAHVLDVWILAKLAVTTKEVSQQLERYSLAEAARPLLEFVTELSQWYIRRSRERLKGDDAKDRQSALSTLRLVLRTTAKLLAPFTPFIAETIFQKMKTSADEESVHLAVWPDKGSGEKKESVLERMADVRQVVELGLALRAEKKLKVRQPLAELKVNKEQLSQEYLEIIADELNVKKVVFAETVTGDFWANKTDNGYAVWLDIRLTDELKEEGMMRDVIRAINQMRKDQGLTVRDKISVTWAGNERVERLFMQREQEIRQAVVAARIIQGEAVGEPSKIADTEVYLRIERI